MWGNKNVKDGMNVRKANQNPTFPAFCTLLEGEQGGGVPT